jgi:23S rRNA (cytosine1962-C5)-methyltransferase
MSLNNLNGIRWILEDAVKFVKREIRRGNKYHGIIMDPPAYGVDQMEKNGSWKMESMIY